MSVIWTPLFYLHDRYMQAVCEMRLTNVGFLWVLVGGNSTRPLSPFVDGPFPLSRTGWACGLAALLAACGLGRSGWRRAAVPGGGR